MTSVWGRLLDFLSEEKIHIDIFLTTRPSLIEKCKSIPGVSDHNIVFVEARTRASKQRKILLWKHVDISNLRPDVLSFSNDLTSHCTPDTDVNTLWNSFKEFTCNLLDDIVPSKMTSTRFTQPWINRKVKRISRKKKRAYKKAKHSRSETTSKDINGSRKNHSMNVERPTMDM